VNGDDVSAIDSVALRRRIGYVPQDGGLLPHWRVQRNVELVLRLNGDANAAARARAALSLVGLEPEKFGDRWPRELSGGQRQRVAIARALAAEPAVMLLDEPFGALDAITRSELQDVYAALRSRLSITSVLVTHDLHEAFLLATHIAVLRRAHRTDRRRAGATGVSATPYVRMLLPSEPASPVRFRHDVVSRVGHRVCWRKRRRLRSTSVRSSSRPNRSGVVSLAECSRNC
jgi:osmoprotectant transport system ATP-binding protein